MDKNYLCYDIRFPVVYRIYYIDTKYLQTDCKLQRFLKRFQYANYTLSFR